MLQLIIIGCGDDVSTDVPVRRDKEAYANVIRDIMKVSNLVASPGDINTKISRLSNILSANKSEVYILLGVFYHNSGQYDKASECYKRALYLNQARIPRDEIYHRLSLSKFMEGDFNESLKFSLEALKDRPEEISQLKLMAMLYFHKEEYQPAINTLIKATIIQPENYGLYMMLGAVYERAEMPNEALGAYQMIIEMQDQIGLSADENYYEALEVAYLLVRRIHLAMGELDKYREADTEYQDLRSKRRERLNIHDEN